MVILDENRVNIASQNDMALSRFKMEKDHDTDGRIWYDFTCRGSLDWGPLTEVKKEKPAFKVGDDKTFQNIEV